jgi:hypothetical protein
VSRWKKSQASSPSTWLRRNVCHEVSASRGAGPFPWARRIRRRVDGLVALGEAKAGEISDPRVDQIAGASSSKAATTRTVTGSSTPSS